MSNHTLRPAIIAHRGASAYLPEHSLAAKALAVGMGADFLEQDVVASRDGELVVLHDVHLDAVSDVARRFPDRARADGHFYALDFDLGELRQLCVHERRSADGAAVYPGRFPTAGPAFEIHTLDEELGLLRGLERSTGRAIGIYPEIKRPAWHRREGFDISRAVLDRLAAHGYDEAKERIYLQCFDHAELSRIAEELDCRLPLIALIGANAWGESPTDFDAAVTADGLDDLAGLAAGIGPWIELLYAIDADGEPRSTGIAERAHTAGLEVHPYTFRADALPPGFGSFDDLLHFACNVLDADALFTDFPDLVVAWRGRSSRHRATAKSLID